MAQKASTNSVQFGGAVIPQVTPKGTTVNVSPGANSYTFTLKNTGTTSGAVNVTWYCSGVASCTSGSDAYFMRGLEIRTVTVNYTASSSGGTGTIELDASNDLGDHQDYGWISVSVPPPTPTYNVSVTSGSVAMEPGSSSYQFTVQNNGNTAATYTLTPACSGVVTGCGAPATVGPVQPNGGTAPVSVSYSATTRGATGTFALTASYGGYSATGSLNVSVNNSYGVIVSPHTGTQQITPGTTTTDVTFNVTNSGSSTVTYNFNVPVCGRMLQGGCTVSPTSTSVAPGGIVGVAVTADVTQLGPSFAVELDADDVTHGSHDAGTVNVSTVTYTVAVHANVSDLWAEASSSAPASFSVHNSGTGTANYSLSWNCARMRITEGHGVTSCSGPTSVTVGAGATQTVVGTYVAGQPGDSGVVRLTASAAGTSNVDSARVVVYDRSVAVTPDAQAVTMAPGSGSQQFIIKNVGNTPANYTLSASCNGVATSCSPGSGSILLNQNTQGTFGVGYSALGGGQNGGVTLTAVATVGTFSDAGSINVHVNDTYFVSMLPRGDALAPIDGGSIGTATMTVTNTGTGSATYNLTPVCTNVACPATLTPITLLGGASTSVPISYTNGAPGTSGRIVIRAVDSSRPTVQDSGWVTTSVKTYFANVRPDNSAISGDIGSSRTQVFTVADSGNAAATYSLTLSCTGVALNCSGPGTIAVGSAGSSSVTVNYTVAASAGIGTIKLKATAGTGSSVTLDSGWVNLTASTNPAVAGSAVLVSEVNPGTTIERSQCVVVAIVRDVADECGALRVVHSLPAVRTLGTSRVPTLVYLSDHVQAPPLAVDVLLADAAQPPTTIRLDVIRRWPDGTREVVPTLSYPGSDWATARHRRLSVPAPASMHGTGIMYDTVEVHAQYGDSLSLLAPQVITEMAVVDRTTSPFGGGWWLAGLEQLYIGKPGGAVLWVGGDGSTRKYTNTQALAGGDTVYLADAFTAPDTLLHRADGLYRRLAGNGLFVEFDASGFHTRTVNRHGYATVFGYSAGHLTSIQLPPWQGATPAHQYTLAYNAAGLLDSVIAPAVNNQKRTVVLARNGTLRGVQTITEHLGDSVYTVAFGFQVNAEMKYAWRADRRNVATSFVNEPGLPSVAYFASPTGIANDSVRHTFRSASAVGANGTSQPIDSVYLRYDGPRPDSVGDVTKFWLDRFGAPVRIVNALGQESHITRGDPRFPGLITESRSTNNFTVQALYNGRGTLDSTVQINPVGDGRNAVTKYEWHPRWNMATKITLPEGEVSEIGYIDSTGDRQWQRDARGTVSRVNFQYTSGGQLEWIIQPGEAAGHSQHLEYDAVLGNLRKSTTPMGFVTQYFVDAIGRDTLVMTPIDSAQQRHQYQRTLYTLADQDSLQASWAPVSSDTTQLATVYVRKQFDREGAVLEIGRWTTPDPNNIGYSAIWYDYDAIGRPVKEYTPSGTGSGLRDVTSTTYDLAGNVVESVTRRGHHLTMSYDPLNRLVQRVSPAVVEADTVISQLHYPLNSGSAGLTLPQDIQQFGYDSAGHMTVANNRDARITRHYLPGGALDADTLRVRAWNDTSFAHVYGLNYRYDREGRRTRLVHPQLLAPRQYGVLRDSTKYEYGTDGSLSTITDPLGDAFTYHYDARGRLDSLVSAGRVSQRWFFDEDDRVSRQILRPFSYLGINDKGTSTDTAQDTRYHYDARGKAIGVHAYTDSLDNTYDGLGALSRSMRQPLPLDATNVNLQSEDQSAGDGMGRLQSRSEYDMGSGELRAWTYKYQSGTGRLLAMLQQSGALWGGDTTTYDPSGNTRLLQRSQTVYGKYGIPRAVLEKTMNYYGADDRLRIIDRRTDAPVDTVPSAYRGAYEEFRYDALGRRIATLTKRDSSTFGTAYFPIDPIIERYIWDGDQLLYETHYVGNLEADTNTVWFKNRCGGTHGTHDCGGVDWTGASPSDTTYDAFSGRVAYTHGTGIDQPLSIIRVGYGRDSLLFEPFAVMPFANWRGSYERGFNALGGADWTETHYTADGTGYQSTPLQLSSLPWAAPSERAFHGHTPGRAAEPQLWFGGLITGQEGQSQLLFRRNRFYDPIRGQFTQEDPIGLAGGLNVYGFGAGDPVNYSDPFGLCPPIEDCLQQLANWGAKAGGASGTAVLNVAAGLNAVNDFNPLALAFDGGYAIGSGHPVRGALTAGLAFIPGGGEARAEVSGVTNLAAKLAAEELLPQVGRAGVDLAGGSARQAFRQAGRYASEYGGAAADYVKRGTRGVVDLAGGYKVQLHYVENVRTGAIYDVKMNFYAPR